MLNLSIREIHDAFKKKRFSALELVKEHLAAAKTDSNNVFLTICEERALAQAKAADEALAGEDSENVLQRFPLLGIPLGIKDNLVIDGVRTTCASRMLENYVSPYTATVIARLESAGAITLGKLNMDEFAMGSSNENSAFGPVLHPTHPDRVPGGSSGASAAAVRSGLCVAALGSDTGGSIRLPASFCGVVGVKPTYGRVSRYGLVAFASSLDQVGPLSRTVEDSDRLLQVMAGWDPLDSTSAPQRRWQEGALSPIDWTRLRVGVPQEFFVSGVASDVERRVQEALRWMEAKGARLVPVSLTHLQYSVATYYVVAVSEASSNLARFDGVRYGGRPNADTNVDVDVMKLANFYKKVRAKFGPEVKRRIILGTFALSSGYYEAYYRRACQVRRLIRNDFDQAFEKVDLIAGPVAPTTAFRLGEKFDNPLQMYLNDFFTIPANLAGLPALSVPWGMDAQGLPIGLQLIGPPFGDERLLSVAAALEKGRA